MRARSVPSPNVLCVLSPCGDPRLDDVERTLRREKAATRQRAGVHRYVCGAVRADARVAACAKGLCAQMPTSLGYENTLPWKGGERAAPRPCREREHQT